MAHLYVLANMCALPRAKSRANMAIYHLSASIVKRSAGRSVVAAAAYRAAAKIEDITTGLVHDYTRKKGVDHSEILSPISDSLENEWLTNRQELWNRIEEVERRKDAQLARDITLAIPRELSRPEQIALVREYVQTNYVAAGMVADVNLHHLDGENPHAHVLLTLRNLQTNPEGKVEFGLKNTEWNRKELLITHRKSWQEITNKYLVAAGSEAKIDCRSLQEQGSPFIPQIHVGVHATAMKRKGISTDRSDRFDLIEVENNEIRARLEEIYQRESAPKSEPEPEPELGKLVDNLIPPRCRNCLRLGDFRIQRGYDNYVQVVSNLSGIKILEFTKEENNKWNTKILSPKYTKTQKAYSPDYINELVSGFERCVKFPTQAESDKFRNEIDNKYDSKLSQNEQYSTPYLKNNNDHKLGKLIDELLEKWGQRIFHPEDIKLVFYKIKPDQISVYIDDYKPQCTRICSFKFIDDRWINIARPKGGYSIDSLITIVNNQHHRFDMGEIKKLELTDLERQKIPHFSDWCGLELNDSRLTTIRERGKEIINEIQKISLESAPPEVRSGDVVNQITLISQKLADRGEQKVKEPESESKPAIVQPEAIESKPTSEDLKSVIAKPDLIIEEEQPIKVAEINQPTIKKTAKTKTRRLNQDGR